ncbi:uncharacterized protein LOC108454773 [Gossypium arboreum]|uniref:uncharacterized protein LOC108454773 n=1 Tax=Gossypium arboreum TaxID=29729 RepID=UPI00081916CB|nr:uncharacterized protein LOC108454773 [Gossypium arboreum]
MPKERRFSAPLGPDFSDGDGEESSDDVAAGVSGVRGVEGWWLARGKAKGSAPRVAAEKIKANNDDPPSYNPPVVKGHQQLQRRQLTHRQLLSHQPKRVKKKRMALH